MKQKFPLHQRLTLIAILAALLVFAFRTPWTAHAYSFEGYRWVSPVALTYTLTSMDNHSKTAWLNGINAWNNSIDPIGFSGSGGDIILYTQSGNNGYDGWTDYTSAGTCKSGYLIFGNVFSYLNTYYTNNYPDAEAQSVAAHELGHAVGLGHSYQKTLMYYSTSRWTQYGINTPQTDDENGATALYSSSC